MNYLKRREYLVDFGFSILVIALAWGYIGGRTVCGSAGTLILAAETPVAEGTPDPVAEELINEAMKMFPNLYEIDGTAFEPIPAAYVEDFFARLEAAESVREFYEILHTEEPPPGLACAGVVVTLRSETLVAEVVTDPNGRFRFIGLPPGWYTLSVEKPVVLLATGEEQMAIASHSLQLNCNREINLQLRDDFVKIKGRIVDAQGRPIGGAKVIAELAGCNLEIADGSQVEAQRTVSCETTPDGSYELRGIAPPNLVAVCRYLTNGSPGEELGHVFFVDVGAQASGFAQDKNSVTRVPLVTERSLYCARRLLQANAAVVARAGREPKSEKEGISLPSSQGNTITGIDFILQPSLP